MDPLLTHFAYSVDIETQPSMCEKGVKFNIPQFRSLCEYTVFLPLSSFPLWSGYLGTERPEAVQTWPSSNLALDLF